MAYSFKLFLVVSILFHCYGINGQQVEEEEEEEGPQLHKQSAGSVDDNGGYIIQQLTLPIYNVGPMFFLFPRTLLYADSKVNGSLMIYDTKNGKTESQFIKELEKEKIVSVTGITKKENKVMIGSDLNLRMYDIKEHTIESPLVKFNEPGFIIKSACVERNGVLFILLRSKDRKSKLGKLYKIQNKTAELVRELKQGPVDFRFNQKSTMMFMIYENGNKIKYMNYDLKNGTLDEKFTDVFDKEKYPQLKNHSMRSIVMDQNPENVWVIAAGQVGYLLEISYKTKSLVDITPLPNKDLTYITIGNEDYGSIFIGSKRTCVKEEGQGSIYGVRGMNRVGVTDKTVDW